MEILIKEDFPTDKNPSLEASSPLRSPDLTPQIVFLSRGFLKSEVYEKNPWQHKKSWSQSNMKDEVKVVTVGRLRADMQSMLNRAQECFEEERDRF